MISVLGRTLEFWKKHPAWLPAVGILGLVLFNAVADWMRNPAGGIAGAGTFLHITMQDGVPAGHLIAVLYYGGAIAIVAIGMTPVIATGGVDLSVGSVMAMAGAAGAAAVTHDMGGWAGLAAGVAMGLVCGAWNGALVCGLGLQPFVATLVLMVAGRGVAQMITGSSVTTFHDPVIEYLGLGRPACLPLPMPFLLAAGLLAITAAALRSTALGLFVEAVGGNAEAARLAGVRSKAVTMGAYLFCGACAGLAGLIAAADIKGADPFNAGRNAELQAIFAVVAGGTALSGGRLSILGAFAGALLLQCLTTTMYARDVSADVAPLPEALVILLVCALGSMTLREWVRRRAVQVGGRHT